MHPPYTQTSGSQTQHTHKKKKKKKKNCDPSLEPIAEIAPMKSKNMFSLRNKENPQTPTLSRALGYTPH